MKSNMYLIINYRDYRSSNRIQLSIKKSSMCRRLVNIANIHSSSSILVFSLFLSYFFYALAIRKYHNYLMLIINVNYLHISPLYKLRSVCCWSPDWLFTLVSCCATFIQFTATRQLFSPITLFYACTHRHCRCSLRRQPFAEIWVNAILAVTLCLAARLAQLFYIAKNLTQVRFKLVMFSFERALN